MFPDSTLNSFYMIFFNGYAPLLMVNLLKSCISTYVYLNLLT